MGQTGCLETLVTKYEPSPSKVLEEPSLQLHRVGSVKCRKFYFVLYRSQMLHEAKSFADFIYEYKGLNYLLIFFKDAVSCSHYRVAKYLFGAQFLLKSLQFLN